MEEIYLAGGCLWGVQEFARHLPGVVRTEAGRANGEWNDGTDGAYDGYAECVRIWFDPERTSAARLTEHLFEIIDPYSVDRQGPDAGRKYRTGVYSQNPAHLDEARGFIAGRPDRDRIAVEVKPLSRYVRSDEEHQDRLARHPDER